MKVFLGNKYNSYIHTARNTKATSTRNVYEKTNETDKERSSEAYFEPTRTFTVKLLTKIVKGVT